MAHVSMGFVTFKYHTLQLAKTSVRGCWNAPSHSEILQHFGARSDTALPLFSIFTVSQLVAGLSMPAVDDLCQAGA